MLLFASNIQKNDSSENFDWNWKAQMNHFQNSLQIGIKLNLTCVMCLQELPTNNAVLIQRRFVLRVKKKETIEKSHQQIEETNHGIVNNEVKFQMCFDASANKMILITRCPLLNSLYRHIS